MTRNTGWQGARTGRRWWCGKGIGTWYGSEVVIFGGGFRRKSPAVNSKRRRSELPKGFWIQKIQNLKSFALVGLLETGSTSLQHNNAFRIFSELLKSVDVFIGLLYFETPPKCQPPESRIQNLSENRFWDPSFVSFRMRIRWVPIQLFAWTLPPPHLTFCAELSHVTSAFRLVLASVINSHRRGHADISTVSRAPPGRVSNVLWQQLDWWLGASPSGPDLIRRVNTATWTSQGPSSTFLLIPGRTDTCPLWGKVCKCAPVRTTSINLLPCQVHEERLLWSDPRDNGVCTYKWPFGGSRHRSLPTRQVLCYGNRWAAREAQNSMFSHGRDTKEQLQISNIQIKLSKVPSTRFMTSLAHQAARTYMLLTVICHLNQLKVGMNTYCFHTVIPIRVLSPLSASLYLRLPPVSYSNLVCYLPQVLTHMSQTRKVNTKGSKQTGRLCLSNPPLCTGHEHVSVMQLIRGNCHAPEESMRTCKSTLINGQGKVPKWAPKSQILTQISMIKCAFERKFHSEQLFSWSFSDSWPPYQVISWDISWSDFQRRNWKRVEIAKNSQLKSCRVEFPINCTSYQYQYQLEMTDFRRSRDFQTNFKNCIVFQKSSWLQLLLIRTANTCLCPKSVQLKWVTSQYVTKYQRTSGEAWIRITVDTVTKLVKCT